MSVLELQAVGRRYGELRAVDDVTLAVEAGSRHAVIGPNGAGKSTLFHLISGTVRPTSGRVRFAGVGRDALGAAPAHPARHGSHVPALEPVRRPHGARERRDRRTAQARSRATTSSCRPPATPTSPHARRSCSRSSASADLGDAEVGSLSYGHRRQLEVALALATEPSLLLLDEPTAGMSRDEAQRFLQLIAGLPAELTIMIVEHDMDVVFGLATVISVLDAGRLIASGSPDEIRTSAAVQEAYLGPGDRMEELFTS